MCARLELCHPEKLPCALSNHSEENFLRQNKLVYSHVYTASIYLTIGEFCSEGNWSLAPFILWSSYLSVYHQDRHEPKTFRTSRGHNLSQWFPYCQIFAPLYEAKCSKHYCHFVHCPHTICIPVWQFENEHGENVVDLKHLVLEGHSVCIASRPFG